MANFYRKLFCRKDTPGTKTSKVYDISDYDNTFNIPVATLRLVGLRLTRTDSKYFKLFWSVYYWYEFSHLFVATWLELINIAQAAKGGTFQDAVQIFSMMPCVGYLLLAMSKSYMIEVHRPVYENLMKELRDMWPRLELTNEEHAVVSRALRHLNYAIQGYFWCNNVLLVIFLSPPFIEIIKIQLGYDGEYFLPFFFWLPYDPMERFYTITLLVQTWHGGITIGFMLSSDLLFCIFISHITTQFDLLSIRIKRFVYVPVDKQLVTTYPLSLFFPLLPVQDMQSAEKNRRKKLAELLSIFF